MNSVHVQIHRLVRQNNKHVNIVQLNDSISLMMTLVASGLGVGFASMAQLCGHGRNEVVIKQLAGQAPTITTYMLHNAQSIRDTVLPFMKLLNEDVAAPRSAP